MPKVSVIVPVYRVEKYIERCARSLFEQTLDDMEYIFVDDHTPDGSMDVLNKIIEEYPSRADAVKIIHNPENLGLPKTRKAGIENASGEYIAHCDSDDWVDKDLYAGMYDEAVTTNSDIVICDIATVSGSGITYRKGIRGSDIRAFIISLLHQEAPVSMLNKLIRRSVYDAGYICPSDNMGEDMATTLQLVRHCRSVSSVEGTYYYYDGTSPSITRNETKAAIMRRAVQACNNVRLVGNVYSDEDDNSIRCGLVHLKFLQRKKFMPIINYQDALSLWRTTFPEINKAVLFDPRVRISVSERVKFFFTLVGIFPWFKEHFRKNITH